LSKMNPEELAAFLRRPLVAVLTTVRPDGRLHATPVWFEYEGGRFYFWVGADSVKMKDIRKHPEAAVCIATQEEPYQYVSAQGPCEVHSESVADRCLSICRRYYAEDAARAFVKEDLRTGDSVILVLKPRQIISEQSA
jgi:PPOX class probable F420-dependent enzyme